MNGRQLTLELESVKSARRISLSLFNVATINVMFMKKRSSYYKLALDVLSKLVSYRGGTRGLQKTLGIYSDLGFAGNFNTRKLTHNFVIGNHKKKEINFLGKNIRKSLPLLIRSLERTENISVSLSPTRVVNSAVKLLETNYLFEGREEEIKKQYKLYFLMYVMTRSSYYENLQRMFLMNRAKDSAEKRSQALTMMINRKRQEMVTNDLSIICSSFVAG